MDKLRVGIIGMGAFGAGEAEIVRQMPNAEFVAGVRRTPEAAAALQERFGVPIYRDWLEMLDNHEFDLVAIAATNETHRYMTEELIRRGIAVHCQKPMGITLEDAQVMRDASVNSGVFLQIGFECRYSLLYSRVKEMIDAGELGDVVQIYFNYSPGAWTLEHAAWKVKASSGGLFANKLNHYVDILRWLIGKPLVSVSCTCAPKVIPYYEFTDNAFSTYNFEGGAIAHILFNQTSTGLPYEGGEFDCYRAGHRLEYTVVGTKGSAFVDIWHSNIRVVHNYVGEKYYPRVARYEDYADLPTWKLYHNVNDETQDIVNRVQQGRPESITPEDAYQSTLACLAADLSMERQGLPITLPEVEALG
ncbi:MAG TPA: Gfo/Idh/MocA family oxidoreductase [Armatimonadota bacterium]|jgi:predicted dehydrogenase